MSAPGTLVVRSRLTLVAVAFAVVAGATLAPRTAHALSFLPTEAEWAAWPEYCRARYVVSGAGVDSAFVTRIDPALVRSWEARMGAEVWYSLHHFCAGLAFADRAKVESDKKERQRTWQRAVDEYNFTFNRLPQNHPMRAEVGTRLGLAYAELGAMDEANRHFDIALAECAECEIGYQGKAMFLRSRKELAAARDLLLKGDAATGGQSAQLNYMLGLVLVDLQEFEAAREHARKAYELGYPLPGLRDRLARAGHPL